jgi:CheY-like chemotaxis protein
VSTDPGLGSVSGWFPRSDCDALNLQLVYKDNFIDRWLFSTQSGHVAKKRAISEQAVGDSFRRVALSHGSNDSRLCAVLRHTDGHITVLNEDEFEKFCEECIPVTGNRGRRRPDLIAVHAYVHSRGGDGAIWRNEWSAPPDSEPTGVAATRTLKLPGVLLGGDKEALAEGSQTVHQVELTSQLDSITEGIVQAIELRAKVRVAHMALDYAIDQGGRLFLVYPGQIVTRPLNLASRREAVSASKRMAAGDPGASIDEIRSVGHRLPPASPMESRAGARSVQFEGKEEDATDGIKHVDSYLRSSGKVQTDPYALKRAREEASSQANSRQKAEALSKWRDLSGQTVGHGWRGAILFAENDWSQGLPAVEALAARGFSVTVMNDGPTALQATRTTFFDCALLATELPSLGAVDITRIVRQRESGTKDAHGRAPTTAPRLSIVAFTGRTDPDDLRTYMDAGLDGCVAKPLDTEALLNTLTAAVPEPEGGPPKDWTDSVRRQDRLRAAEDEHRRTAALAEHVTPGIGGLGGTAIVPIGSSKASRRGGVSAEATAAKVSSPAPVSPLRTSASGKGDDLFASSASLASAANRTRRPSEKVPPMQGRDPSSIGPPLKPPTQVLPVPAGVTDEAQGVFQLDAETAIPYAVVGKSRPGAPLFHFVICHDMFDTLESMQIFVRSITAKYAGARALMFNYPGQAFTEWRKDALLNNEYLAGVLQALLVHVSDAGTGEFGLDGGSAPFFMVGFGTGGGVATYFATAYHGHYPNMRALLTINGFAYVDSHLAGVLHDCMNVFACSPPSRPDLPVYFFSRFLFSPGYLSKVGAPLALNLYTAVHNPITLDGRIQLCQGVLSNVDCRDALEGLSLPVICVASAKDALIKPTHVQAYVNARGGEERSLRRALKTRRKVCVVWLRAGHEVLQEARKPMTHLLEQLATGYHERHDVAFLPLATEEGGGEGASTATPGSPSKASAFAQKAMMGASGRATAMSQTKGGALDASGVSKASQAPKMYEEQFLDSVVGAVRAARRADESAGRPDDEGGASMQGFQYSDVPAALATAPPTPPGIRPSASSPKHEMSKAEAAKLARSIGSSTIGMISHEQGGDTRASAARTDASKMGMPKLVLDPTSAAFEMHEDEVEDMMQNKPAAEVKEYMQWRVRRNRKRLQRLEGCVVQIQRCWRAYLARTLVARMRQQRAALTMQRWWRGCLGRKLADQKRREIWAARVVQKYWRGFSGRSMAWRMQAEERAARSIQRSYRGWRARRFVYMLRSARHEAATRIQTMFRRRQAMRSAWELRDKHNAAINVQRVWRGYLGRAKARKERDKYLFSKSQSQGIEFGRQMLLEHKLHGTKLQSEVSLLTKEKLETEEAVEAVLAEIATFEAGVRALEKEMVELSRAEAEAASTLDEESKAELRENKMRLDREFGEMLVKIADRREKLQALERKLQTLDRTRQAKKEELADLERKLVVLLEEQQRELASIKARQAHAGEQLVEDAVTAVTGRIAGTASAPGGAITAGGGGGGGGGGNRQLALTNGGETSTAMVPAGSTALATGPTAQERAEANALMASTETMMKFGFMSMSLTYFSSLNMIRAMRKVGAANTVLANPALQGGAMMGNPMAAMAMTMGSSVGAMGNTGMMLPQASLGATGSTFRPAPRAGETVRDDRTDVSLWTVADVGAWLDTLSLGQYKDAFADAAIDGAFLFDLTDEDLRNTLGIEHALHRKKVLHAIRRLRDREREVEAQRLLGGKEGSMAASLMEGSGWGDSSTSPRRAGVAEASASSPAGPAAAPSTLSLGKAGEAAATTSNTAGALKLDDLMSWVRHNKGKKLADALRSLADRRYDPTSTRVQFVPDYGTQYEDAVARLPFHINKADEHGNTLLLVAAQNGHMRICQLLVKKGGNPDHQNGQGQTAMHYSMSYGYTELGQWLVDPDGGAADDSLMNMHGLTPYDGLAPA